MIDNQEILRERPVRADDGYGGQEDDWSTPDSLLIGGCSVQPGASEEDLQNRSGTLIQWTVYAPGHPDVQEGDRVLFEGEWYAVDGRPARWPGAAVRHTVILLKAWEG